MSGDATIRRFRNDDVIRVRGLTKRFGEQAVLEELDLDVQGGEILGLVGASGSGKSVLLRTILGLEAFQAGHVVVLGSDMAMLTPSEQLALQMRWGVLFQDGALFGGLSVLQNVQVPMREHRRMSETLMDELARLKLAMVGLDADVADKQPSELSGGMRKRAGLARALALDPELVFLDEPTAGLDPIVAAGFDALIAKLQVTLGLTVCMVTHDLDSIFAVCDRVAVLADRRIATVGAPQTLRESSRHPWVREYFNGPRGRGVAQGAARLER